MEGLSCDNWSIVISAAIIQMFATVPYLENTPMNAGLMAAFGGKGTLFCSSGSLLEGAQGPVVALGMNLCWLHAKVSYLLSYFSGHIGFAFGVVLFSVFLFFF